MGKRNSDRAPQRAALPELPALFLDSLRALGSVRQERRVFRFGLFATAIGLFLVVFLLLLAWFVAFPPQPNQPRWLWYLILSVPLGVWSSLVLKLFREAIRQDQKLQQWEDREVTLRVRVDHLLLDDLDRKNKIQTLQNQGFEGAERLLAAMGLVGPDGASTANPRAEPPARKEEEEDGQLPLFKGMGRVLHLSRFRRPRRMRAEEPVLDDEEISE